MVQIIGPDRGPIFILSIFVVFARVSLMFAVIMMFNDVHMSYCSHVLYVFHFVMLSNGILSTRSREIWTCLSEYLVVELFDLSGGGSSADRFVIDGEKTDVPRRRSSIMKSEATAGEKKKTSGKKMEGNCCFTASLTASKRMTRHSISNSN